MARECKKCGKTVAKSIWIDGKKRNCQHRKYCFECSPYGLHNTKKLELARVDGKKIKTCPGCGKEHYQKANLCFACAFQSKQKKRHKQVIDVIGEFKCWKCGYNKAKSIICFHHVNEEDKLFGLTTREMMYTWTKVLNELKKCIPLCANCHGELHCGIIPRDEIKKLWEDGWSKINSKK